MRLTWSILPFSLSLILFFKFKPCYGKEILHIGTYNVENLWDGMPDNTASDPLGSRSYEYLQYAQYSDNHSNWYRDNILKAKVRNLLTVLEVAGYPEIMAFQEVESAHNSSQILTLPSFAGRTLEEELHQLGYESILIGKQRTKNPTAVTTMVIGKIPLIEKESVDLSPLGPSSSHRDPQVVEFEVNGARIVMINNHWKSKRGGFEETRIAMAKLVRNRIELERTKDPKTKFIVIGDFNAQTFEKPILALGATGSKREILQNSSNKLFDLWFDMEQKDRWDCTFNGVKQTLTHIFLSDSFFNNDRVQYLNDSVRVVGKGTEMQDAEGMPLRWQIQRTSRDMFKHIGEGFSDHFPLIFALKKLSTSSLQKAKIQKPKDEDIAQSPKEVELVDVPLCNEKEAIDIRKINSSEIASYIGKCVFLRVINPLPIYNRGLYQFPYVDLATVSKDRTEYRLGLSMTRAYDPRPNIDDSRVKRSEILNDFSTYENYTDPRSNKCYQRHVLQGYGGAVKSFLGRLGYNSGYLNVMIASRESKYLTLVNLPATKKKACPWQESSRSRRKNNVAKDLQF